MNPKSAPIEKADERLRLALLQGGDTSLCAIFLLDLPDLPDPPSPKEFPARLEWRKELIARNEVWVEQQIGETIRQLGSLGLNPRGGFLGQVVVNGPASSILAALELDRVTYAVLDREIPFEEPVEIDPLAEAPGATGCRRGDGAGN